MDRVSHFWLMKELSIRMCVCVGGNLSGQPVVCFGKKNKREIGRAHV